MAVKNNRRTHLTRLLLKNSLIELMHQKSISQISIKELCENADLNRSTFYSHYTDQHALLADIENEIIANVNGYLSASDAGGYIEQFLIYIKNNQDVFRTLLCMQQSKDFQNRLMTEAFYYLKRRMNTTSFGKREKYLYTFFLQGAAQIIIEWINADFDLSAQEISELLHVLCDNVQKEIGAGGICDE